jgi:hypothetical protein
MTLRNHCARSPKPETTTYVPGAGRPDYRQGDIAWGAGLTATVLEQQQP